MSHTYKILEMTGSSSRSMEDAINQAIMKASETIRHLRWFQVIETRGDIDQNKVAHWQVSLKIGFTLED